jgi:hypothetical protein
MPLGQVKINAACPEHETPFPFRVVATYLVETKETAIALAKVFVTASDQLFTQNGMTTEHVVVKDVYGTGDLFNSKKGDDA